MGVPGPDLVNISFSSALSMLRSSFRLTLSTHDSVCRTNMPIGRRWQVLTATSLRIDIQPKALG
jgi:hypothetical protein